jgi:hypothetical protein
MLPITDAVTVMSRTRHPVMAVICYYSQVATGVQWLSGVLFKGINWQELHEFHSLPPNTEDRSEWIFMSALLTRQQSVTEIVLEEPSASTNKLV